MPTTVPCPVHNHRILFCEGGGVCQFASANQFESDDGVFYVFGGKESTVDLKKFCYHQLLALCDNTTTPGIRSCLEQKKKTVSMVTLFICCIIGTKTPLYFH